MTQPLNIKVDSGQARADLDALAKSLDAAGAAAGRMSSGLSSGMGKADAAIKGSMGTMEKFAQVAAALNKIKVDSSGTKAMSEFSKVLGQVAKTKEIEASKMASWSKFIEIGALTSRLKMDPSAAASLSAFTKAMEAGARARAIDTGKMASWIKFIEVGQRASQLRMGAHGAVGFTMFAQAMDNVAKTRAISNAKLKSWVDFIEVAARTQRLNFDPKTVAGLTAFGNAMSALKAPGKASIERLQQLFTVLAGAKRVPGAQAIARDLEMIAMAAGRAAASIDKLPASMRNMGTSRAAGLSATAAQLRATATGAHAAGGAMAKFGTDADKAGKHAYTMGERLRGLNHRFSLAYQAGTLFSAMFASFTVGGFIKGVYDASVSLQKLEKAMLFSTRSFEGSKKATNEFIGTVYEMGLALDQVAEPFGRFTISAGAAGLTNKQSSDIFKSISQTLQVVGASAEQTGYAFYGLTQMIQKGKVSSEEFNRQIGEQIPGNAVAGARAMSRLKGEMVSVAQFYDEMRKGKIMSAEFVPVYAQELEKMFGPLMSLIQDRPDIAINRLKTAFTVFQQAIGKSSFIQEIGIQMNRLANTIGELKDGVFTLKPRFAELAKQLGQNLASMVRKAGDALVWLSENFEKVVFLVKMVATLYVATHFLSWGKAAMTAVTGIQSLTKSLEGLVKVQQTLAATPFIGGMFGQTAAGREASKIKRAERIAAREVAAAATAAPLGAKMADIQNFRAQRGFAAPGDPRAGIDRPNNFGRRTQAMNGAGATAMAMGMRGSARVSPGSAMRNAAQGAGAAAAGALRAAPGVASNAMGGIVAMGKTLGLAMGGLGIAAVATAATLAILSDKTTTLGDTQVKFKDILSGAVSMIGTKVRDFFDRLFSGMGGTDGFLEKLGPILANVVTYLTLFGEVVGDVISTLLHMGKAAYLLFNGDTAGAKREVDTVKRNWEDNNPFDQRNIDRRNLLLTTAAIEQSNKRMMAEQANSNSERIAREAALKLQEQAAANDQLVAAQIQLDAANQMSKTMEMPTMASVTERIARIASGQFARENPNKSPEEKAAGNAARAAIDNARQTAATPAPNLAAGIDTKPAAILGSYTYTLDEGRGPTVTASTPQGLAEAASRAVRDRAATNNAPDAQRPAGWTQNGLLRSGVALASASHPAIGDVGRAWMAGTRAPTHQGARQSDVNRDALDAARAAHAAAMSQELTASTAARAANGRGLIGTASSMIGQNERDNNRSISAFLSANGGSSARNLDPAKVAWCAAFVNAVLGANGVQGTNNNLARSFTDYGTGVERDQAQVGDIVVFERGNNPAQGHVGFFNGYTEDGRMKVVGGNQSTGRGNPDGVTESVRSTSGLLAIRRAPGGADAAGGGGSATATENAEDEREKALNQKSNDWKSLQSILALPDPASQSIARANALAEQLNDLAKNDEARIKEFGDQAKLLTVEVVSQIEAAKARIFRDMSDNLNPIGKMNRMMRQTNDLTLMTVRGLGDQAEWQEHINDLKEQGYDVDLMKDEAKWQEHINRLHAQGLMVQADSLNTTREQWEMERKRERTLQAQVGLMEALNEAQLRRNARSGAQSQEDVYFNELVNQSSQGGTLEQKRARLEANPEEMQTVRMQAQVQALSDRADALRRLSVEASDAILTTTMTASQAAYQANLRDAMEQITGMSNATMGELHAAIDKLDANGGGGLKSLAEGFAKLRHELDNQPGFARWADSLDPLAKRMEDIKMSFLDGLSDGITDTIMGEEVDWQAMFKNIRRQMVKAQVDSALASVTNFLSGRKPGEAALSPEARAVADGMAGAVGAIDRQTNELGTTLQAMLDKQQAEVDARDQSENIQRDAAASLNIAANALREIARALTGNDPEAVARAAALAGGQSAEQLTTRADALSRGAVSADAAAFAAVNLGATAPVPAAPSAATDPVGFINSIIGRFVPQPAVEGVAPAGETAARSITMPAGRAVQAALPQSSGTLNRTVDQRTTAQRIGSVLAERVGATGGMETDRRMATAGAMGTSPTQGPIMSISEGEDGGLASAAAALFQAAGALAAMPAPFGQVVSDYAKTVETFAEVVEKMGKAIEKLAEGGSGGGGGGNPLAAITGGGGGSGGPDTSTLTAMLNKAEGGYISGVGGPKADAINARLSNGEFVINAAATSQNRALLEAINDGKAFATGGYVDGLPGFAGGGWFSGLKSSATQFGSRFKPSNMKDHFFGEGGRDLSAKQMGSRAMSGIFGKGQDGEYNGPASSLGQMFGKGNSMETRLTGGYNALNTLATLAELFGKKDKPEADPKAVQGVIGEHRGVTIDATEIAAHENPWALAIGMGMDLVTGGQWGKAQALGQMAYGSYKTLSNAFADGGYVSSGGAGSVNWASAPHYAEGTANTSGGGMPAVVHPNEAIIPLSGGRTVPVDMSGLDMAGTSTNVTSNITIVAPNPDAFRKSQGSIQRQQNRDARRASARNLTG